MPRPSIHTNMTSYEKYQIFKEAYKRLNNYIISKELLAAHVLAFSILEDRVLASRLQCAETIDEPLPSKSNPNKIPFEKSINKLYQIGAITPETHQELIMAANERNEFLHQAMWRLDEFNIKSILRIRKLINAVEKSRRHFIKLHKI